MAENKRQIENNPFYQEAFFTATRMVKHIKSTKYGTLEEAIRSKKELIDDLKNEFGWDETHPDVVVNLGYIAAWEKEKERVDKENEGRTHDITLYEVDEIALSVGKIITEKQAQHILDNYLDAQDNAPDKSKELIIEELIYQIVET